MTSLRCIGGEISREISLYRGAVEWGVARRKEIERAYALRVELVAGNLLYIENNMKISSPVYPYRIWPMSPHKEILSGCTYQRKFWVDDTPVRKARPKAFAR